MCKKCDNPIYSDKYDICVGEEVRLARIVNGKVKEWMLGKYNSYGRVHVSKDSKHFIVLKNGKEKEVKNEKKIHEWKSETWENMVDEQFNYDIQTGIVAIHNKCWNGKFGESASADDPAQGWRDYENEKDDECEGIY